MSIHYSENLDKRTNLAASGISSDSNLLLDVAYSGSERKLSLAELKKTGVQVVNVKQYGAVGDGVANDTSAFQAAITAAGIGGTIYVPNGTYVIQSTLTLLSYQNVFGSGQFSIIKSSVVSGQAAIQIASYSQISDLRIQGPGIATSSVGLLISGVGATPYARGSVHRVRVTDCGVGVAINNCHIWTLLDCYATTCGVGVHFGYGWTQGDSTAIHAITLVGGEITQCPIGVEFGGQGSEINFNSVTIEGNTTYGVRQSNSLASWSSVNFLGCYFEANGTANILLESYARLWKFDGCKFSANATTCLVAIVGGASSTPGQPYNTTFVNCQYGGTHANSKTITINAEARDTIVEWSRYHNLQDSTGLIINNSGVNSRLTRLDSFVSFTSGDTTPSVQGLVTAQTANASATTISALDDGCVGQSVTILINDANTTVDFTGTTLKGNGGVDWTPASGDHMVCTFNGTNWYCIVSEN